MCCRNFAVYAKITQYLTRLNEDSIYISSIPLSYFKYSIEKARNNGFDDIVYQSTEILLKVPMHPETFVIKQPYILINNYRVIVECLELAAVYFIKKRSLLTKTISERYLVLLNRIVNTKYFNVVEEQLVFWLDSIQGIVLFESKITDNNNYYNDTFAFNIYSHRFASLFNNATCLIKSKDNINRHGGDVFLKFSENVYQHFCMLEKKYDFSNNPKLFEWISNIIKEIIGIVSELVKERKLESHTHLLEKEIAKYSKLFVRGVNDSKQKVE